jgi:hypothetical protein
MSSGDPSKLLTSLNILITGKDRAPEKTEPEKFRLGACLDGSSNTVIIFGSGILAVMVGSDRNREKSATGYDHRITASIFWSFSDGSAPYAFTWEEGGKCTKIFFLINGLSICNNRYKITGSYLLKSTFHNIKLNHFSRKNIYSFVRRDCLHKCPGIHLNPSIETQCHSSVSLMYFMSLNRLVHVTRHFADQVLHADYESDIFSLKEVDFCIENRLLNFSKNRISNFLTKKFTYCIVNELPFCLSNLVLA